MIPAYPACYLVSACKNLADAFDFAIETQKIPGQDFLFMLASSSYGKLFAQGNPWAIAGVSGIEATMQIAENNGFKLTEPLALQGCPSSLSPAYWVGWALAHYQWFTARNFAEIARMHSYQRIRDMYNPYHEMDVSHFIKALEEDAAQQQAPTALKRLREECGLSQAQLAKKAQVGLRSIQMYEQRNNDIDKAQAANLWRISRALGCSIEDLLEDPGQQRFEYAVVEI